MKRRRKVQSVSLACVQALKGVQTTTLYRETDPTPERLAKAGVTVAWELGTRRTQIIGKMGVDVVGCDGVVRLRQAPLDRMNSRQQLDADPERNRQLFEAGEKLRHHHFLAGLSGIAANDLNGGGGGHPSSRTPITETMESNRRALRMAECSMDAGDWRTVSTVVCEEISLEEAGQAVGFGQRHAATAVALDRVRRGLGQLAELWGYSPPPRAPRPLTPPAAANDPAPATTAAA